MLTTILGAIALITTGLLGAMAGLRVRDHAATRARLQAYHADLQARAAQRMVGRASTPMGAEARAPHDRDALVRELRRNGRL